MSIIKSIWRRICGPPYKERSTGVASHHPSIPAGEFDAAWMRERTDRLNAESARLEAARHGAAEKNASVRSCWLCWADVPPNDDDPELPVVCVRCEPRQNPNPRQ